MESLCAAPAGQVCSCVSPRWRVLRLQPAGRRARRNAAGRECLFDTGGEGWQHPARLDGRCTTATSHRTGDDGQCAVARSRDHQPGTHVQIQARHAAAGPRRRRRGDRVNAATDPAVRPEALLPWSVLRGVHPEGRRRRSEGAQDDRRIVFAFFGKTLAEPAASRPNKKSGPPGPARTSRDWLVLVDQTRWSNAWRVRARCTPV